MQKGTVIEGEVMHRSRTAQDSDGAKPCGGSFVQNRESACSNPARISKKETVTVSVEDNAANDDNRSNPLRMQTGNADTIASTVVSESQFQSYIPYAKPEVDLCSSIKSIGGVRPKRIGAFLTRVLTVMLVAVMTVSLGTFASDMAGEGGAFGPGEQSAYAATSTTPYTNIDVPLTSSADATGGNNGNTNNSDNANPDRVEASDGDDTESEASTFLGPIPSAASGRMSEDNAYMSNPDQVSEDEETIDEDPTYTNNGYTVSYNKDENGIEDGTYTLLHVDPKVGKVATLTSGITDIAEGAFIDCPDLETIIVYGKVKSIAKTERDFFGKTTKQGAFTDEQLKKVHVVFAINTLHSHDHDHDLSNDASDVNANGLTDDSGDTDSAIYQVGVDQDQQDLGKQATTDNTPVDEGVKRLSGDVALSTPASKSNPQNQWAQVGFNIIEVAPTIGATNAISTTLSSSADAQNGFTYTVLIDYTLEVAWNGDADMSSNLVIPDYGQVGGTTYEVSQIADGAFKDNDAIQTLTMQDNMRRIGDSAFEGCINLSEVTLPNTLASIGSKAFQATNIRNIQIPNTVTTIGELAFANCPNLTEVASKSVNNEGEGTFSVEGSVEEVSDNARSDSDEMSAEIDTVNEIDLADTLNEDQSTTEDVVDSSTESDINATAFNGSPAQIDDKIYRTTYLAAGEYNSFRVNPSGGKFCKYNDVNSVHFASKEDVANNKRTNINGVTSTVRFYYGNGGSCHLAELNRKDVMNSWTASADGEHRHFYLQREGYWFNGYISQNYNEDYYKYCDDCNREAYFASGMNLNGTTIFTINWEPEIYTVKFNPHGGTIYLDGEEQDGDYYISPYYDKNYNQDDDFPTAKRSGYTFDGWYTSASGGDRITGSTKVTTAKDHTLHAQWTANWYKVNFDHNDGSGTIDKDYEYEYKAAYDWLPTLGNWTWNDTGAVSKQFLGWYTAPTGGTKIETTSIMNTVGNNKLTLYAQWNYSIRWNVASNGGHWGSNASDTAEKTTWLKRGETPTAAPATPAKPGYSPNGWHYNNSSGGTSEGFIAVAQNDTKTQQYWAWFKANTYKVTWDLNNPDNSAYWTDTGNQYLIKDQYYDSYYNIPNTSPTRPGYDFDGWWTAATGGNEITEQTVCKTAAAHTIYAHWNIKTYTITLSAPNATGTNAASCTASNGWSRSTDGKSLTKTYEHFATLGTLPTATRPGYTFKGWRSGDLTGTSTEPSYIGTSTSVSGAATYHAVWSFNVSYSATNKTSGDVPATTTYYTGSSGSASHTISTMASQKLTRTNYNAYGWAKSNITGTSTAPTVYSGSQTVYGNTTFYAVWSFQVRYSATNKTTGTIPSATTYYTGSSGTATHTVTTNTFTRTHYDWNGWAYTDIAGSTSSPTTYTGSITVSPNDDTNKCRWLYATWKFYVGYNGNNDAFNGTVPSDVTLYAGSDGSASYTTQNPSLTQRGYKFGRNSGKASEDTYTNTTTGTYSYKWNTKADASGDWYTGSQSTTFTPTNSNVDTSGKKIVLYGQWTLINYDITYNLNGGKAENNPSTYNVRTASFTLNKPVRPGYDFSPGRDANGQFTISTCGWTGNYNSTAKEGQASYSMPRTDTLTISQGSIGQITLTANWHLHEYQISYSLNGGSMPALKTNPSTYNVETATFTLVNPEKYPYSFQGWTVTGADEENGAAIDTQGVQTRILKGTIGTLVCTAGWESFRYNINYDGNGETGGSTSATPAEYGKSWTAATNGYTKDGFQFSHWNTQANGRGQTYEPGKTYSDNLVSERGTNATLFAIWKANPYTVRFNPNYPGATQQTYTQEMYCGEDKELAWNRFSRTGYTFAGWSEIEGTQPVKFQDHEKVRDLETVSGKTHELYAQWTPITYTVVFDANAPTGKEVTGATATQTLTYDNPVALNGNGYIIEGYHFEAWSRSSSGTGTLYGDHEMIPDTAKGIANLSTTSTTIVLYAKWSPVRYTVTYHKNNSGAISGDDLQQSTHTYDEWKTLTSLDALGWAWTGHHFEGWYTESNLSGTMYEDAQRVQNLTSRHDGNVDLYAKWAPDVHRVTLDARGGTYVQSAYHDNRWSPVSGGASAYRDIEYGDHYASELGLPTFRRDGYNFAGWWTVAEPTEDDPGTQIAAGDNHVFLGLSDQTLYARWTPITYGYRFAIETAEGGTRYLSDVIEVDFETEIYMPTLTDEVGLDEKMPLKKFAKQGYLIIGWSKNVSSQTSDYAFGSYKSGLTTQEGDVVVIWAIQTLGDYYITYYKDTDMEEEFFRESIRKGQDYELTSAKVERPGYTQTHWEIPSAGHIKYVPGAHIQTNNILTGQFEVGDEVAVIPVWQKVQFTVNFYDEIGTKWPSSFSQAYEDRVSRLNKNQFTTQEGDYTFEGYWTEPSGGGIMLYDANGRPAGPNANEDGVWRYAPEDGITTLTLYAKWTCPVTFEFPYGGGITQTHNFIVYTSYADIANAKNFEFLGEDEWGNLVDANYVDTSWYVDWIKGLFNPVHAIDPAHEWAGWYTKPELGRQVPTSKEVEEPTTLYGCWKVYAEFNYWDAPAYSSGWTLMGNNLERVEDEENGAVSYRQQLIQGQTYQTAGLLPTASRAGYVTEADCWNDDPEGGLVFRVPGVEPTYDEAYRISKGDVMRHDDDFDVYLEYSLGRASVKVERYLQDIGGIDYTHVEDADSMDVLGTESLVDDAPYRNDAPSSDYVGFTYEYFDVDSTDPSLQNREGRVAGDGTTVVRLYYERHTFDLTLEDFWVTNAAGEDNVRGAGAAQGTYPRPDIEVKRAESESYGTLSGVQTSAGDVMEVWYGQTVELNAVSDAGYAFDGWLVTDGDGAGYAGIVDGQSALTGDAVAVTMRAPAQGDEGEGTGEDADSSDADSDDGTDPNASAQSDIPTYTFTVRDSAPYALAKFVAQDVPYVVEAYFEGLTDASTSTGTFMRDYSNARGADMDGLMAKTDSMTKVVAPGSTASDGEVAMREVAGFDVAYVEVGSGSSVTQSGAVIPSALKNSTDAKASVGEDPSTFEDAEAWIGNGLVKGDGTTIVRVFYKRCSYAFDVNGSTWADATGASGTAPARLALFDDATHGYIPAMSEDVEDAPGRNTYAAFYESQVSVAARAVGHAELIGYVSDKDGIAGGEHGETYGYDSESLLDGTLAVPEDTDGLPQWDDVRYQDSMYGFAAKRMPATDVSVTVQAQPVRATYISRYLFQDADPGSETTPAGTYTLNRASEMDGDASYEIEVTRTSDDARLLRYWMDGTDAEDHALDGTDVSSDAATRDEGLEIPPTGFEPSDATDAITPLSQLVPEGNEIVDGKPMSVTYSKYDRKRHDVTYAYAGGPNEDKNQRPDGVDAPETVNSYYGATVHIADTPSVNGYDFDGWMWQADPDATRDDFPYVGEGTDSESVRVPDFDVAITGTWSALPYTLTYDGGTAEDTPNSPMTPTGDTFGENTVLFDSEWQVSDVIPERAGYAFLGWTFADKAIFEAIVNGPIDISTGDVDDCKATLGALNDFDGNPLLLVPGQSQVWTWHEGDRTLHAVWMRSSYDVTFDLGQGTWPNGTSVPLTYMTGAEVKVPQPASEGYEFTGWEVACDGSPLEGDAPAVSYVDGDPTRATINEWAYGNMAFTAKYDVKRFAVNLNPAGGTFDGEPGKFMDRDIDYAAPDGNGTYGQATVHIPYQTEITSTTPLPEPSRPGYDFSGWTDGQGNPVGWTLDDDGNKVEVPYMFDDARDATWVASWRAHRYSVTYDFGEYADSVTIDGIDSFSEYFAGMTDEAGNVVTSFMLPTASDLSGIPENVSFDGWYPQGGEPENLIRSFDPNAETGDKVFVARFSTGANAYTERFWLEVLDQTEDVEGKQYAFIGETKFALDESLSVTRRTNSPNAQASMSAISGFTSVNPYDGNGVSIYPTEHPYVCVFSAGQDTVNGFYARETHSLTVGTANGIEDGETTIQVSPASALVRDADVEDGAYAMDESTNVATLKGISHATVKWGAKVNVGVTCPRSSGYAFVAWQTDAGATPADIDVRANPTAFTMPDANVVLNPSTELVHFKATYKDAFGKDVFGAGQATFTVNDEFALKNLDDMAGHAFRGWEAYVADEDGNKLDPEANPVPSTVGYDEDLEHMWVREGTATDLVFEAKYAAVEYTVSVALPKGTAYLPNGMPDGLPEIDGINWVLMPGDDGTDAIGFTYTIEDLSESFTVDLTGINCAPYEVNSWSVVGANGESNVPSLEGGVLTLSKDNLGDWNLNPDVSPIRYEFTLDMSDVRDGYVPIDTDMLISELEAAGYEVEDGDVPGTLKVTFDVETASAYTLPTFEKEDESSAPEFAFRGWAKTGDAANASNPYVLPPADIAAWPKKGVVIAPVWAKSGEQTTLVAHLPNDEGDYVDDLTFTFVGDALTPIDYSQDERFLGLVNDVDDKNVGYHLVWHGTPGLTDDDVTTLPTNFPESGTQEVWGEWVEDDDIITVGFGVKWDNSAPPGETKPRSAFALNAAEVVSDTQAGVTSTLSMRGAYADDEMPTDGVMAMDGVATIDDAGDAVETPIADANSTYYYIPNKGLYTKDANGKYHLVTRIANIDGIAGSYAGWRLEGFYLPIDAEKPERIIIGPDGEVDNATFVEVAGAKPTDLTFTVRWARISLVEIDMVGGYGEGSDDLTLYYWPEKDAFVKGDDNAIGDMYSAPRAYSKGDFNTGVMLDTFAIKGIPESKEDAEDTRAFIGYFGETAGRKWDFAEDTEGNPLPVANALALTPIFSYLAMTDDYGKQVTVGTDSMDLPYGYDDKDDAQAYDPTAADGTTKATWRAAWEGDLDAIHFNATVPMSMSFMVRADGTAIGPEAGAYQIRNYSNTAISVEDVSFEWAEESELEALFGKGATDALALSATPTDGQPGYAQTKVLLERANATQDAVGSGLVSRYVFGADKWVIAKSVGVDPGDFTGDATMLPALKLDYDLTSGGIRQLTQENASQDTTHPIGTLKFTLKTVR